MVNNETEDKQLDFQLNHLSRNSHLSADELAWMAGFFDGEGSIEIRHTRPTYANRFGAYRLIVHVSQIEREVLNTYCVFGGKVIELDTAKGEHSASYRWRAFANNAKRFLERVLPYLKVKTELAKIAIEFQKRIGGKGKILSAREVIERDELIKRFDELQRHRRGVAAYWAKRRKSHLEETAL